MLTIDRFLTFSPFSFMVSLLLSEASLLGLAKSIYYSTKGQTVMQGPLVQTAAE